MSEDDDIDSEDESEDDDTSINYGKEFINI